MTKCTAICFINCIMNGMGGPILCRWRTQRFVADCLCVFLYSYQRLINAQHSVALALKTHETDTHPTLTHTHTHTQKATKDLKRNIQQTHTQSEVINQYVLNRDMLFWGSLSILLIPSYSRLLWLEPDGIRWSGEISLFFPPSFQVVSPQRDKTINSHSSRSRGGTSSVTRKLCVWQIPLLSHHL